MLSELTKRKAIAVVALLILLDTCISTICETACGQVSCDISYKAPLRYLSSLFKSNAFLCSHGEEGEDQKMKMAIWQHCCSGPDLQQHHTGKEIRHGSDRIQCVLSFADFKVLKKRRISTWSTGHPLCETYDMNQNGWAWRNAHCKIHDITHLLHSDTTRMAVVIKVRCNEFISDKDV